MGPDVEHYGNEKNLVKHNVKEPEWSVIQNIGDIFICSNDFTHDVCLGVTGDFATLDDKKEYAEKIAAKLNK